ncbi:hypothetical protein AB1L07_20135 [Niallia alba]|uniref:hypothetical protein n=1 Tax=Niallia alba TaxID=2729105 RepID=UPI00399EF265
MRRMIKGFLFVLFFVGSFILFSTSGYTKEKGYFSSQSYVPLIHIEMPLLKNDQNNIEMQVDEEIGNNSLDKMNPHSWKK